MVSTRAGSSRPGSAAPESPATPKSPAKSQRGRRASSKPRSAPASAPRASRSRAASSAGGYDHAPTFWTTAWLAVSLPLVIWDTFYVLGRPHTMEGGWMHYPLWAPYKLYGEVDHVYGWKHYNSGSGFTSAQGALNAIETVMYLYYAYVFFVKAQKTSVSGRQASGAVLTAFSAAVMTLSKTLLYCKFEKLQPRAQTRDRVLTRPGLNEYYSGFDGIGHNDLMSLIFLWIIPKYVFFSSLRSHRGLACFAHCVRTRYMNTTNVL